MGLSETPAYPSSPGICYGLWRWSALRWAPRELDQSEKTTVPSVESDVYFFGSVMLQVSTYSVLESVTETFLIVTAFQVLSGKVPYSDVRSKFFGLRNLLDDCKPNRPADCPWLNDDLWSLINRCWAKSPQDRPKLDEVGSQISAWCATCVPLLLAAIPVVFRICQHDILYGKLRIKLV